MKYCKLVVNKDGHFSREDNVLKNSWGKSNIVDNGNIITFLSNGKSFLYTKIKEDYFIDDLIYKSIYGYGTQKPYIEFRSRTGQVYEMNVKEFDKLIEEGIDLRKPITGKWSLIKHSGYGRVVYRHDL